MRPVVKPNWGENSLLFSGLRRWRVGSSQSGRGWPACPKAYALREAYKNTFGEMCPAEITCSGAYFMRREKIIGRAQGAWLRALGVQILFPDQFFFPDTYWTRRLLAVSPGLTLDAPQTKRTISRAGGTFF
jgi:hypothetical protein